MSAFKPIDRKKAVLKATSGHQASVIERFDCVGGGGPNGCEGHIQKCCGMFTQECWEEDKGVYQEGEGFVGRERFEWVQKNPV